MGLGACISLRTKLVNHLAIHIPMLKNYGAFEALALHGSRKKSTFNSMKTMVSRVVTFAATSVQIARCANAELVHLGFRMDRMILPMAITANGKKVVGNISSQPVANFIAFVFKLKVGMIIAFVAAIGTNQRGWSN